MNYSAAIVGLGSIGVLYDLNARLGELILSHASALNTHPGFRLMGGVDLDPGARAIFSQKYNLPSFQSIPDLISFGKPDVVVIATPTNTHFRLIKELLNFHKPLAILCEKPLAYTAEQAVEIQKVCEGSNVQLYVNYMRRVDAGVMDVKTKINSGHFLMPFKAIVWYSKGLLHNGSHFYDLMKDWFGSAKDFTVISNSKVISEYDSDLDLLINYQDGSAIFCAANSDNYPYYSIEILFKNGKLTYDQEGSISWYPLSESRLYKGYQGISTAGEVIPNNTTQFQYRVAEDLFLALEERQHNLCDATSAVEIIRELGDLIQHVKNGK
jgi:predicted dehydrogenase